MNLEYNFSLDMSDGKTALFTDTSLDYGQPGNPDYADVKAIRLVLGNYTDDNNVQTLTAGAVMDQWRQYQNQDITPFVYDNKTIPLAGRFIPFIAGITVDTGNTMKTTGQYSQYISPATYLPDAVKTVLQRTVADFGINADGNIFPDRVYYATYEIYGDTTPTTLSNVTEGVQYIIHGAPGDTAIYNGNTYRPGEVFIASDNGAIFFTGTGTANLLLAIRFKYFIFAYECEKGLAELILKAAQCCNCAENIMYRCMVARALLDGLRFADIQNATSAKLANDTIQHILSEIKELKNCCENA